MGRDLLTFEVIVGALSFGLNIAALIPVSVVGIGSVTVVVPAVVALSVVRLHGLKEYRGLRDVLGTLLVERRVVEVTVLEGVVDILVNGVEVVDEEVVDVVVDTVVSVVFSTVVAFAFGMDIVEEIIGLNVDLLQGLNEYGGLQVGLGDVVVDEEVVEVEVVVDGVVDDIVDLVHGLKLKRAL